MKSNFLWQRILIGLVCSAFLVGGIFLNGSKGVAGQEKKNQSSRLTRYTSKSVWVATIRSRIRKNRVEQGMNGILLSILCINMGLI